MAINNAAAAFIGASVTLVLVIIFMILMVVLIRQCLSFIAKRTALRAQAEAQQRARAEFERQRRGSITEPVPATFDWHHSIRIAGTPPPSYREAKKLPPLSDGVKPGGEKRVKERRETTDGGDSDSSDAAGARRSVVVEKNSPPIPNVGYREFEDGQTVPSLRQETSVAVVIEQEHQVNGHLESPTAL